MVGIALGFVTDLLTNNVLRFFEKTPGANARWMMFPRKGYASLPLNLIYAFVLLLAVVGTYHVLNTVIMAVTGAGDTLPLGVEPILFGLITLGWDLLLIKMKHTLVAIGRDAARKASGQG